jgi:hypothetical protein
MDARPTNRKARDVRMQRWRRPTRTALVGLCVVVATLGLSTQAGATSTRCALYDHVALFCARTTGKGTYVDQTFASYGSGGPVGILDNAKLEVQFVNTNGQAYDTIFSALQKGRKSSGGWKWIIDRKMKIGLIRYTLLSNGAVIATIEQSIT